ncbi:MAG: recombination mediator RecR [Bifidobacteriaceae bacterium]|jgi:recombination protein RecR|nr:recombination mediator RecR [Bifidobacteriaceae bacterium]
MEKIIAELIEQLEKLPGIGPKAAQRIAYYFLNTSRQSVASLLKSVANAKDSIKFCQKCGNYAVQNLCSICSNSQRNKNLLCVVEQPKDIIGIEASGKFLGLYLVLGGQINPIDNIGPDDLRINLLLKRVQEENISEIILATNLNLEGEVTANYIKDKITQNQANSKIKITRIASGLPAGSDIEFADEITLGRAIDFRTKI